MDMRVRKGIQPAFLQQVGIVGRKTGLRAKENVRKDEYDMDDVDDFFTSSGSEFSEEDDENVMPVALQSQPASAKSIRGPLTDNNQEARSTAKRQSLAPPKSHSKKDAGDDASAARVRSSTKKASALKSALKSASRKSVAPTATSFVVEPKEVHKRLSFSDDEDIVNGGSGDFDDIIMDNNNAQTDDSDDAEEVAKLPMPQTASKASTRKKGAAVASVAASPAPRVAPEAPHSERLTRSALKKSAAVAAVTEMSSPFVSKSIAVASPRSVRKSVPGVGVQTGVEEEAASFTPRRSARKSVVTVAVSASKDRDVRASPAVSVVSRRSAAANESMSSASVAPTDSSRSLVDTTADGDDDEDMPRGNRSRKSKSTRELKQIAIEKEVTRSDANADAPSSPAPVADYDGGDYGDLDGDVNSMDHDAREDGDVDMPARDDAAASVSVSAEAEAEAVAAPVQKKRGGKRKREDPALREIAVPAGQPSLRFADDEELDANGNIRRSKRTKVAPLEFWKNERVVYDRRKSGAIIKEVIKREGVEDVPKRTRQTGPKKPRQRPAEADDSDDTPIPAGFSVDENPMYSALI
eukprot:Opistho-2@68489